MKLTRIKLTNFRCFESLDIEFSQNLTVLVAPNAGGKTSILDAIAYGFGTFLTRLPRTSGIKIKKDTDLLVQLNEYKAPYLHLAFYAEDDLQWDLFEKRDQSNQSTQLEKFSQDIQFSATPKAPSRIGRKQILSYADRFIDAENEGNPYTLPIVAYYGTDRAFNPVKRRENFQKAFSRFEAFSGALNSSANFRRLFEWFDAMENIERRGMKENQDFGYELPELSAVRQAIKKFLPTISKPRIELRPLRFLVDFEQNGLSRTLRIEQLSDGYRLTLAMVMDIAARMAEANPDAENILDTAGVILIDEVDQHLHPGWQQRILDDLTRTFPNIQFIVTTHSPQVLSTVKSEHIRLVMRDTDPETGKQRFIAKQPTTQSRGVMSSDVMAALMDVDPVPDVEEAQWLSHYKALIQKNQTETTEGVELRHKLKNHFGSRHQEFLECDRLLRLEKMKAKISRIKSEIPIKNVRRD